MKIVNTNGLNKIIIFCHEDKYGNLHIIQIFFFQDFIGTIKTGFKPAVGGTIALVMRILLTFLEIVIISFLTTCSRNVENRQVVKVIISDYIGFLLTEENEYVGKYLG